MKKYSMKCTCGDVMTVDANSKEEAIATFKKMMDQAALDAHWEEKHKGDQNKPTLEMSHKMIEQTVTEGVMA